MPKLPPSPQVLVERLLRALPHPPTHPPSGPPPTEERILDAALAAFSARGIRSTTMSKLAEETGISREWLYKHFRNRDAVVIAVAQREVVRFIDGLAVRAFNSPDLDDVLVDAFVFSVEYLRDHALLQRVLHEDAEVLRGQLLVDASPIIAGAIAAGAGYLSVLGDLTPGQATVVAETLVRLVAAITLLPQGQLDLHDGAQLRSYAAAVVPAVLAAGRATGSPGVPSRARPG